MHNCIRRQPPAQIYSSNLAAIIKALGILQAFSFISRGKSDTINIHRLVQLVTRKWLAKRGRMAHFAREALMVVSEAYPFGEIENREQCLQHLPHAEAVLVNAQTKAEGEELAKVSLLETLGSMNDLASAYWDQGRLKEAESLRVRVLETRQRVLGEEHPETLVSIND
jgi:hypothetical protein